MGDPACGANYGMDSIAATVIGGTSLAGGTGLLSGTVAGAFLIGMLSNVMNNLNVNQFYQYVMKGALLIAAMVVYSISDRLEVRHNLLLNRSRGTASLQPLVLLAIIVVMTGAQAVLVPGSLTVEQMLIISRQASALGIITLGQAAVILVGGIDLSVGATVMMVNIFCISAMQGSDANGPLGLLVCLFIGLAIGTANAFGVLFLKIAPFVMTLCTTTICEGICYVYTQGSPTGSAAPFIRALGTGRLFGIPFSTLIWLALAAAMWVVLRFTALGRRLYAVGGSPKAARLSGIANVRVVAGAYIFCALMSAVAGLILTGYHNIASLTLAGDYSMNSLAAALIGGNAIEGGRGGVWGVVLGSFFMMLLMAILTMLGISQVGKLIIQGCIILAVVAAQQLWKKD